MKLQGNKTFVIHWPERILGRRPGHKLINLISWGMFGAFLIVPLFVTLWFQFTTGSGSIRKFDSDFVYFYGIGHIANEYPAEKLYDYNLQQKIFNEIYPAHSAYYGLSPYPPFVALFFRPFARLSFESAYLVWMGASLVFYITGIAAVVKEALPEDRFAASVIFCFALAFYPFVFSTLLNGQLAALAVFSVGIAIFYERRSNPFCSGLTFSLLTYKPTLLVLILPMLFLTRKWKVLFGFLVGTLSLITVTTVFDGIDIWPIYARVLGRFGQSAGLTNHSALQLWKYIDFNSFSYAAPGGRSRSGLAILTCVTITIALGLGILLWKSANSGRPAQYLSWAASLTWTLLVNIYVPIYDSILLTISVVLTLGALKYLARRVATGWTILLSLLIFGITWETEAFAQHHRIQLFSIFIAVLGVWQISMLYRAIRQRSPSRSGQES